MKPVFFADREAFRAWLDEHHGTASELWMGLYKRGSGRPSISWPEAVDEALCFGWIDSVRQRIDDDSYMNRFTPRKPNSNWSAVNLRRVEELTKQRRMRAAGLKAFRERREDKTATYSYEQRHQAKLDPAQHRRFRSKKRAWEWFQTQPKGYRTTAVYWVMSAKRPETRERRLTTLIEDSAQGRRVPPLRPRTGRG
ncbi:MAG TPA: YdeI/OmpD-associated family protein [Actinomycetota bacterium]|nr:YdeI/OmpD-associated family protein [Actinomycetota bacterium]